jgi:hypothetical protein
MADVFVVTPGRARDMLAGMDLGDAAAVAGGGAGTAGKFQPLEICRRVFPIVGILLAAVVLSACATVPYRPGQQIERAGTLALRPGEAQIERGRPNVAIDSVGWVLGIPSKIILWNRKVDNHRISTNTEVALAHYLAANDMANVKVRVNQYAPGGEWSRLFRNKRVGWGWRYTFGLVGGLFYTILPGRLLGGDHYNPYTETINLYSDHPAIALHEGGHAKDFAEVSHPGSYAALNLIPLAPLYFEKEATADALGYVREHGTPEEQKAAYKILYPAYGTYVGGGLGQFAAPASPVLYVAGVLVGHVAGRAEAAKITDQPKEPSP